MLESYESVSPTAILTSYPRIITDIPYEKDIYEWLNKNCNEEVKLNKLLAPELEARFKLANKILDKQNATQVLELAAGYTSRGLAYSQNEYKYVEMDLEEVSNNKKKIINDLFEDENHIRTFFGEIGFNTNEIHKFIEVKDELKSFDILGIDKDSCDELLDSALVAIKGLTLNAAILDTIHVTATKYNSIPIASPPILFCLFSFVS